MFEYLVICISVGDEVIVFMLKMDLATYAIARLATPELDSSSDSTSTSSEEDSSPESISLPTNARALLDELFLCDEDFDEDLEEEFEDFSSYSCHQNHIPCSSSSCSHCPTVDTHRCSDQVSCTCGMFSYCDHEWKLHRF